MGPTQESSSRRKAGFTGRLRAGVAAACGGAPGRGAGVAADGVRDVPRRGDRDAVPVGAGGRLIYRLLSWSPGQGVFLRLVEPLDLGAPFKTSHARRGCDAPRR